MIYLDPETFLPLNSGMTWACRDNQLRRWRLLAPQLKRPSDGKRKRLVYLEWRLLCRLRKLAP